MKFDQQRYATDEAYRAQVRAEAARENAAKMAADERDADRLHEVSRLSRAFATGRLRRRGR